MDANHMHTNEHKCVSCKRWKPVSPPCVVCRCSNPKVELEHEVAEQHANAHTLVLGLAERTSGRYQPRP